MALSKSKLKQKVQDAANHVAQMDAAQRLRNSGSVAKVREFAADRIDKTRPGLREILRMDGDRQMSPESLLLLLVGAVDSDDEVEMSLKDLRAAGKPSERIAAAAGVIGGAPGVFVGSLYADAAIYCLLDDCFDLGLTDEDVAANLLVAWGAVPDMATAQAAIDAEDPITLAGIARQQLGEAARAQTKRDSVMMLWRMRWGLRRKAPILDISSVKRLVFTGGALEDRLEDAADQLGIPREVVKVPGRLRRRKYRRMTPREALASARANEPASGGVVAAPAQLSPPLALASETPQAGPQDIDGLFGASVFDEHDKKRYVPLLAEALGRHDLVAADVLAVTRDMGCWVIHTTGIFRYDLRGTVKKRIDVEPFVAYADLRSFAVRPSGPHSRQIVFLDGRGKTTVRIEFSAAGPDNSREMAAAECERISAILHARLASA